MTSWKQLLSNYCFRENRPQWLIAPLPTEDTGALNYVAPSQDAYYAYGGLVPNVAQNANAFPAFNTSPYHPVYSPDDFAAAQEYTRRVTLSPIGGPYG